MIKLGTTRLFALQALGKRLAAVRSNHSQTLPDVDPLGPQPALPLTSLSEEETAFKDMARKVAQEVIAPMVRQMDDTSKMDSSIIQCLFESGVSKWMFRLDCHLNNSSPSVHGYHH